MSIRWTRDRLPAAGAAPGRAATSFSPLPQPSSTSVHRALHAAATISASASRQKPPLGPRDPVPRQQADRLEEGRAERVVEVLRLELLAARARGRAARPRRSRVETGAPRAAAGDRRRREASISRIPVTAAGTSRRRTDSCRGTSCGSSAAGARAPCRRGALHHVVLPVEEVGGVLRIGRHRLEPGKRREDASTSTPIRCRRGRARPRRWRRAGAIRPEPDPQRRKSKLPREASGGASPQGWRALAAPPACRRPRGGTRPPSEDAALASARRRRLRRARRRPATPPAAARAQHAAPEPPAVLLRPRTPGARHVLLDAPRPVLRRPQIAAFGSRRPRRTRGSRGW